MSLAAPAAVAASAPGRIGPTRRGVLWLGAWVVAAAGAAVWPPLRPAVGVAGALWAVLQLLELRALLLRPLPTLARKLPPRLWQGREGSFELILHNPSHEPVTAEVFEELPSDLGDPEPRARQVVAGGGSESIAVRVCPRVRGNRPLGRAVAVVPGPWGLLQRTVIGGTGDTLRVHPDTRGHLGRDALDPRRLRAELGIRPARKRGDGSEFDSLREYVPGDDPRRLDWAASARRGRAVVRQYRHERNHTVLIAVDASRLMAGRDEHGEGRTKLDHAVEAALALSHAAVLSGDRVGMAVFDRDMRAYLPPRRARRDLGEFVELLTDVQPRIVEGDFAALTRALAVRQRARALIVILSDFAETETASFVGPLAVLGRRHRVLLVALRDRVFGELEARPAGAGRESDPRAPYRRIVVDDLLSERETALLGLRRRGLQTLDLPPSQVTGAVLNRYLAMRESR